MLSDHENDLIEQAELPLRARIERLEAALGDAIEALEGLRAEQPDARLVERLQSALRDQV